MRITNTPTKALQLMFCALLTIFSTAEILAQETIKTDTGSFLVTIEISGGNQIKMECKNGCTWETLTFSTNNNPQAIDESGRIDLAGDETKSSGFLFTIEKTRNGVALKGIESTAWTDLSFDLDPNQKLWLTEGGRIE